MKNSQKSGNVHSHVDDNSSLFFIFSQFTTVEGLILNDKYQHLTVQQRTEPQTPRVWLQLSE